MCELEKKLIGVVDYLRIYDESNLQAFIKEPLGVRQSI